MPNPPPPDPDDQDQAETLDETQLTPDGRRIANFDDLPDVPDLTSAEGDADEDTEEEVDGDDDEAIAGDEDVVEGERDDDGDADAPRTRLESEPEVGPAQDQDAGVRDNAAVTTEDRTKPNRFESRELSDAALRKLGYRR
jgi:hypothetical protein